MTTDFQQQLEGRMDLFKKYLDRSKMDHKQYQYDGVKWCLNNELRPDPVCKVRGGFIADEMGLGKTILMIGTMVCNFMHRTLIILPPVLVDQWFVQIYRTTGHKALVYRGENKKSTTVEMLERAHVVLATYAEITLTKPAPGKKERRSVLHGIKWGRVIFDEAHHLRNKTGRHDGALLLKSKMRWLVSGTPVQNRRQDFYNLCSILKIPHSFYSDNDNLRLLAKSFILKRTKASVGIQLPDVQVGKDVVVWTNRKEMELSEDIHAVFNCCRIKIKGAKTEQELALMQQTLEDFPQLVDNMANCNLVMLMRARQSCIYPKLVKAFMQKTSKKWLKSDYKDAFNHSSKLDHAINDILERKGNGCGKLIFCHYRAEMDEIAERLQAGGITSIAMFDGRTSNAKRQEILNDKNEVIILQIQTGCEGLNLQEHYSEVYFISPNWNPSIEDQAIARVHRIGQTKPVYVKRYEMDDFVSEEDPDSHTMTLDKYVNHTQDFKRVIVSEILK